MSKWREWPDYIPFSHDAASDFSLKRQWYADYRPLLEQFFALFSAAMTARGFTVQIANAMDGEMLWGREGYSERDGFRVYWSVGPMTPRDWSPEEFADVIERRYRDERSLALQGASVFGEITNEALYQQTQSQYSTTNLAFTHAPPAWALATTPGPSTTVPTGGSSLQPTQAPPSPDAGTLTSASPPDGELRGFDEWNYVYQQRTGRAGPAPEEVGFPLERRRERISREEWWGFVESWFTGRSASSESPDAPGAPGETARAEYYTLLLALLAAIGIRL